MTRCYEFYKKWEQVPNWCERSAAAVSQINSYLEWTDAIEKAGVDKKFTYVKLTENVARPLFRIKSEDQKAHIIKGLVEYLNEPNCQNLNDKRLQKIIDDGEAKDPKPQLSLKELITAKQLDITKCQDKLANLQDKLANLQNTLAALETDLETLKKQETTNNAKVIDPAQIPATDSDDLQFLSDKPKHASKKPKKIGVEAMLAKISNHTPEPVPARKTQSQLVAESKNRVEPEIVQDANFKFKEVIQ